MTNNKNRFERFMNSSPRLCRGYLTLIPQRKHCENENIYTDIIEPLGHKAKECNDDYMIKYSQMVNLFTKEFIEIFCDNQGNINWNKLVKFNSEKKL
ncbi:hypothetical protein Holit_00371 [Hollandina sp. SP2]